MTSSSRAYVGSWFFCLVTIYRIPNAVITFFKRNLFKGDGMLKYLYAQQKSKLFFFVVFSLLSSLFEIALSFVMLQSVNLAMDGNLSDALNDGLWFGLYIFCYFIVDLICRRLRWSVIQGCQTHLRDELIKKIFSRSIPEFHSFNTSHWLSILTNDLDLLEKHISASLLIS